MPWLFRPVECYLHTENSSFHVYHLFILYFVFLIGHTHPNIFSASRCFMHRTRRLDVPNYTSRFFRYDHTHTRVCLVLELFWFGSRFFSLSCPFTCHIVRSLPIFRNLWFCSHVDPVKSSTKSTFFAHFPSASFPLFFPSLPFLSSFSLSLALFLVLRAGSSQPINKHTTTTFPTLNQSTTTFSPNVFSACRTVRVDMLCRHFWKPPIQLLSSFEILHVHIFILSLDQKQCLSAPKSCQTDFFLYSVRHEWPDRSLYSLTYLNQSWWDDGIGPDSWCFPITLVGRDL